MNELDILHQELDQNPDDWVVRSLIADWHEDANDSMVVGYRWMITNRKRPQLFYMEHASQNVLWNRMWYWLTWDETQKHLYYYLEPEIWKKLLRSRIGQSRTGRKFYESRRLAEEDLALALSRGKLDRNLWE